MEQHYPEKLQSVVSDLFEKQQTSNLSKEDKKALLKSELEKEFKRAADAVEFLELLPDEQALLIDYKLWKQSGQSVTGVFHWKKRECLDS